MSRRFRGVGSVLLAVSLLAGCHAVDTIEKPVETTDVPVDATERPAETVRPDTVECPRVADVSQQATRADLQAYRDSAVPLCAGESPTAAEAWLSDGVIEAMAVDGPPLPFKAVVEEGGEPVYCDVAPDVQAVRVGGEWRRIRSLMCGMVAPTG
ncbi:hypothetical protein AOA12_01690 [Microbacterium sp. No. 7]|nr:hypothetical protein AOA12_01690 [Microbacterium sp. No. 7]